MTYGDHAREVLSEICPEAIYDDDEFRMPCIECKFYADHRCTNEERLRINRRHPEIAIIADPLKEIVCDWWEEIEDEEESDE